MRGVGGYRPTARESEDRTGTALPLGEAGAAAGVAQLVEHQPSKLRVAGSSPVARFAEGEGPAPVAQSVERILGKDEVTGSTPVGSSGREWREIVDGGQETEDGGADLSTDHRPE